MIGSKTCLETLSKNKRLWIEILKFWQKKNRKSSNKNRKLRKRNKKLKKKLREQKLWQKKLNKNLIN